jgi:hypothetical protein
MTNNDWTEADIQALKAQEAKDLAIDFLHQLENQSRGPITPGEVQLQELEYELKLKEAEIADQKAERAHQLRTKELELEMDRERAKATAAQQNADAVRSELQELVARVRQSEESLAVGLERSMREHRLRLEQLEAEYASRKIELESQQQDLSQRRDQLVEEIQTLTELQVSAEDLSEIRHVIIQSRSELEQQRRSLEEELSTLEFEKTKRLTETRRSQELELARIQSEHEKNVLRLDRDAAEKILAGLDLRAVANTRWDEMDSELTIAREKVTTQATVDEARIREELRHEYNITTDQPLDVTDLFYQHRAISKELEDYRGRLEKCEAEMSRARKHIESEPQRIATAVEAARTQVQNIVEPAGKR